MKVANCILVFQFISAIIVGCSTNIHEQNYIAHAGGEIDGYTYTNSKEAVEYAVKCGVRYVELDLALTSDSCLVAVHDWAEFRAMAGAPPLPNASESLDKQWFIESKIYGRFTPLTAEDIVDILNKYPDITLVTDKISDPNILNPYFEKMSHRVIVECFSDNDYYILSRLGYTCFRSGCPPFKGLYYMKKLLRSPDMYIDRYVTSLGSYDMKILRYFGCLPPPKCEMAIFPAKDRITADSIFSVHPNISFVYVDNVEER